jgi:hypothetical protein
VVDAPTPAGGPRAAGAPVALSEDEVAALTRGQMPEERMARILEARSAPLGPADKRRETKRAPADLTEAELTALAAGEAADSLRARLEKAAAGRLKVVKRTAATPRLRPPGSAGGAGVKR